MNTSSHWEKRFSNSVDIKTRPVNCPVWIPEHQGEWLPQETQGQLYQSGQQKMCLNALLTAIHQAQHTVMLMSFLLAEKQLETALLQAAERGVRVYILTASENKLEKEPDDDDEFDQKILEQHEAMLNTFAGKILLRSASNFHAKLLLTDTGTAQAQGFLLTANLTTEALTRNQELAIRLNATEINAAFTQLRWAFWEASEHELREKGSLPAVEPLAQLPPPATDLDLLTTQPTDTLQNQVEQVIQNAQQRLIICSFGWDIELPLLKLLIQRLNEGLQVTILCRIRPKAMPALLELANAGATVLGFPWLHAKAVWNENNEAIVMSANLEPQSFAHSLEFGVRLQPDTAQQLGYMLNDWIHHAPQRLLPAPTLGELPIGEVTFWQANAKNPLDKRNIKATFEADLGSVIADSADKLETPQPSDKEQRADKVLAHEILYRWTVQAPRLNGKTQEIKKTVEKTIQQEETFEVEVELKDKKGNLIIDKKGKPKTQKRQEKRLVDKQVKEQVSYQPPIYQQGQRKVVAVQNAEELATAQTLIQQGLAEAIVKRD